MITFRRVQWVLFFTMTIVVLHEVPTIGEGFRAPQPRFPSFNEALTKAIPIPNPDLSVLKELTNFVEENSFQAAQIFICMTALMHAFAIPAWIINAWEGGMSAFFPFCSAILCLVAGKVLGTVLAYFASKLLLGEKFQGEENDRLEYFNQLVRKYENGKLTIFLTRLQMNDDELFPQTFVNYAAPICNVGLHYLLLSSTIAALPQSTLTVTLGRLYPTVYALQDGTDKSWEKVPFHLMFIAGVLRWVPNAICRQLTREFSSDLRYKDRSCWRLPKGFKSASLTNVAESASTIFRACSDNPGALMSAIRSQCSHWSMTSFVYPRWAPTLSLATCDDESSSQESNADLNEALKSLVNDRNDKLPGDHRHLLFENVDPIYEEKYCPELRMSDMKDSVTSVTPYSIVDKADSLGILLDDGSDTNISTSKQPVFCGRQPSRIDNDDDEENNDFKQVVHLYSTQEDDDPATGRVWEQGSWKTELMMRGKQSSSCPYFNRLKEKMLGQMKPGIHR